MITPCLAETLAVALLAIPLSLVLLHLLLTYRSGQDGKMHGSHRRDYVKFALLMLGGLPALELLVSVVERAARGEGAPGDPLLRIPPFHAFFLLACSCSWFLFCLLSDLVSPRFVSWVGGLYSAGLFFLFFNMLVLDPQKHALIDTTFRYTLYWGPFQFAFLGLSILPSLWLFFNANNARKNPKAGLSTVFRLIWPESKRLRLLAAGSLACLAAGRAVNVLVPVLYKRLVDSVSSAGKASEGLLFLIFLFSVGKLVQGSGGLVASVQGMLWAPVSQAATRAISLTVFSHVHALSLGFHLGKKTGEVTRVMDRGSDSLAALLSTLLFQVAPTLFDILIAIFFFLVSFDAWFALIVLLTLSLYIGVTVVVTEWRLEHRREMNTLETQVSGRLVDSLLNYETVKFFAAEKYELDMFSRLFSAFQQADLRAQMSLYLLNSLQALVIAGGCVFSGLLLAVHRMGEEGSGWGEVGAGDLVLYLSYISQLYIPLNYFGTFYRSIQQNFIDMENMVALLEMPLDVTDVPWAKALRVCRGEIVFDRVSFGYSGSNHALSELSFTIPAGNTVALVGPSGGGKSTVLRLLLRLYDVQGGSIRIDGQDLRDVTGNSLRRCIGVVPQDTALFFDTVRFNIRYGNLEDDTISDEQIEEAARKAMIHDTIISFPEGYDTVVGERGLRLSGGEKQRVAIARTLLKNPPIVVLDEATSALDTITEQSIQKQLHSISQGRTTLVIAHRLSTIVDADRILVLREGKVVEQGTHYQLLQIPSGVYRELWERQLHTRED